MIPEEIFKRRHYGTPESFTLTLINVVVVAVIIQLFALCTTISVYFWVALGLLAAYNIYNIRRNRESYTKASIIGYIISIVGLVIMFFALRMNTQPC
jgi:FtsH-binding integral membrane protein